MTEEEILRLCMSIAGRKGGRSRSPAKVAAASKESTYEAKAHKFLELLRQTKE